MNIEVFEERNISKKKTELAEVEKSKSYYDNEEIKYFNDEELKNLISIANDFYKLAYLLLFETATRISEARNITFSDLNKNKIKIKIAKQRNKNKIKLIPISDELKVLILEHQIKNNMTVTDYILAKKSGKAAITQQAIDTMIKKDCKILNIQKEKAHIHTLRHTRAIQVLESGESIITVKNLLGHSNIQNTLIYLKYSNHDFENAIKRANKTIKGVDKNEN